MSETVVVQMENVCSGSIECADQVLSKEDPSTLMIGKQSTISFHNIIYEVDIKHGCCKTQRKEIIHGVRYVQCCRNRNHIF